MNTFIQPGDVVTLAAPAGGVVTGLPYQIGQLLVIAQATAAATVDCAFAVRGVFDVPKIGSQAWTVGALVYFDKENARFTVTAAASLLGGVALVAVGAGAGETTGRVLLNGAAKADEA